MDYYVAHPITAGGGKNIAYEVHVYDQAKDFDWLFETPSHSLPVIIGEFGPTSPMTLEDCDQLITRANQAGVPWLAWTFHMRCPPNLLEDLSSGGCGIDMPLHPSDFGSLVKSRL